MDSELLLKLVNEGFSTRQIAEKLSVSQTNARYWLEKFSLTTVKKKSYCCKSCSESNPEMMMKNGRNGYSRNLCKKCHSKQTVKRFKDQKKKAIEYKGNKCLKCGYSECYEAMDFHHRNPQEKDPDFHKMKCWSWERLKTELDKCDLLCCRCHREKHAGKW
jgi:hypothetical protein